MKKYVMLFLTFCLVILFHSNPLIAKAEAASEWKIWPSQPNVKVYKEWEITFSEAVDYLKISRDNFVVVRERDNKEIFVDPVFFSEDQKVLKLGLKRELFDFDETYYLYIKDVKSINGNVLKEPIKMKFQTEKVEFNVNKSMEQDGVKFDVILGQTVDTLYAKVKVTNVSKDPIIYGGADGCDRGLSSSILSKNNFGETIRGQKWLSVSSWCTALPWRESLNPDGTIEIFDVFYLPEQPLYEKNYLEVTFQRGTLDYGPSIKPLEIKIPI